MKMILMSFTTLILLLTSCTVYCAQRVHVNATVGDKVTLPCHTEHPPVDWKYQASDTAVDIYIFIAGNQGYHWPHHSRTELASAAGDYSLTINNVTVNNSGAYTCVEDKGLGIRHPYWLQVYYPDPKTKLPKTTDIASDLSSGQGRSQNPAIIGVVIAMAAIIILLTIVVVTILIIIILNRRKHNIRRQDRIDAANAENLMLINETARLTQDNQTTDTDELTEKSIDDKYAEMSRMLVVSDSLLEKLSVVECFKAVQTELQQQTPENKVPMLLRVLRNVPPDKAQSVFKELRLALRRDKQIDAAYLLSEIAPMFEEHCQLLDSKREELSDFINPTETLLKCLQHLGTFNKADVHQISSKQSRTEKSQEIVNILLNKTDSAFHKFIQALHESHQDHVAYILTGVGDLPLSPVRRQVLPRAREYLLENIKFKDTSLMQELLFRGVINQSERQQIDDKQNPVDKNKFLVREISRKSDKTYDKLKQALKVGGNFEVVMKLEGVERDVCRPYYIAPSLQSTLPILDDVWCATQCDNKLFVVCYYSIIIHVFESKNDQLKEIKQFELKELVSPTDIVSCTETQQLYIAGESRDSTRCVWRVSLDGRQIVRWLPNRSTTTSQFRPYTLSVTSRRLLVTSQDDNELLWYKAGSDGVEPKHVSLPDSMTSLHHAVETSRGTFIISHQSPQPRVCEVAVDGHVMCVYCNQQQLSKPVYLSLDSDGRIFVADYHNQHILQLNSETLKLERVLLNRQQHQLTHPGRLCLIEQTGQLVVAGGQFDVLADKLALFANSPS